MFIGAKGENKNFFLIHSVISPSQNVISAEFQTPYTERTSVSDKRQVTTVHVVAYSPSLEFRGYMERLLIKKWTSPRFADGEWVSEKFVQEFCYVIV